MCQRHTTVKQNISLKYLQIYIRIQTLCMNCGIKTCLKMPDPSSIFQSTSTVFRNTKGFRSSEMTVIFILSPCSITHMKQVQALSKSYSRALSQESSKEWSPHLVNLMLEVWFRRFGTFHVRP